MSDFTGFPGIGKGTVVPNLFFSSVLPRLETPGALLAFLWVARLTQEKRGHERFVTAAEIWGQPDARKSFETLAGGQQGLDTGLAACLQVRALLALSLKAAAVNEDVYFTNDPISRRTIARARAGELSLKLESIVVPLEPAEKRPGIFRLYEEHIGTITPLSLIHI